MFFGAEKFTDREQRQFYFKQIIRKVFLEDWLLKLTALVIAFGLWLGVTGLSTPTTTRFSGVPLTLRTSNDAEASSAIQEVDIVVTGDKGKIAQINKSSLVVGLDLTDVPPGDKVIQLTPENVSVELPTGIKLDEIQPNRIVVQLEGVEEKEVAVNAETEGSPPNGFEVYSQTVTPQKVRVRGPSSFMKTLDFVSTEKIDLATRREDFTVKQVPLTIANPRATVLDTVVDVSFRIGDKRVEKSFVVPIKDENHRKATVVLYGSRSLLANIRPENLLVEIAKTETGEDSPQLILPAELQGNVEIRKAKINP